MVRHAPCKRKLSQPSIYILNKLTVYIVHCNLISNLYETPYSYPFSVHTAPRDASMITYKSQHATPRSEILSLSQVASE